MKTLLNALLAGLALGFAGTVFLSVENKIVGSFLFGFGLFLILCFQFKLYTGAVGYFATESRKVSYTLTLVLIWLGNLLGTGAFAFLIGETRVGGNLKLRAQELCDVKLADTLLSVFILAIFCGILMYVAVESFRRSELPAVFRALMVFLCVAIFILSGFEHCIANMFYFWLAEAPSRWIVPLLVMTLGNSVGGVLIPYADMLRLVQNSTAQENTIQTLSE
ncbi:MAG: formate/nitrite transporter family protein [Planctomycetia bacterium]|nr:formate/nitrite transporter family protein [Planctomycetia bacterium]